MEKLSAFTWDSQIGLSLIQILLLERTASIIRTYMAFRSDNGRSMAGAWLNPLPQMALLPFQQVVIEPILVDLYAPATTNTGGIRGGFFRQLSVHFGSMSFLRRYIVPTSRSFADSSAWTPPTAPLPERQEQCSVGETTRNRSELTRIRQQSLSPPSIVLILTSESKPKFLPPNSFSTMAEVTPTTSLCRESTREGEPNAV